MRSGIRGELYKVLRERAQMNDWYGIPSYNRPDKQPTLEYLEKLGVPKEKILLSTQTAEEYKKYKEAYGSRVHKVLYRQGKNAADNRNTILEAIPSGDRVIIFDDDIKHISRLTGGKLTPIETKTEFEAFVAYGFRLAAKLHTTAFSVYPVHNAFYMSNSYTERNIGEGTLLGIVKTDIMFDPEYDTKEDYEFSCRIIRKFGAMPRLNNIACNAPHYTKGGCESMWEDKSKCFEAARRLATIYPDIVKLNKARAGEILTIHAKKGKQK